MKIKLNGLNRVLIETGITFLNKVLQNKLIKNLYLFKSKKNLSVNGLNNSSPYFIKRIKLSKKNKIRVNLREDFLYKVKL